MRGEELGAGSGGVWTWAQARRAGFSSSGIRRACADGHWQVLLRGTYTDGGCAPGPSHRAWAAVLAAGGPGRAVAAGRTAARLHGLPLVDDDDPVLRRHESREDDVAVRRALRDRPGLHPRTWSYAPAEVGTIGGCPVPGLTRTLWDLRLVLRPEALVCALDAALHDGRVTPQHLEAQRRPGARGLRAYETAVRLADGRAESPLETLTRLVLLPVLPDLEPQVEVFDASARLLARVDLGLRRLCLAVEADGASHTGTVSLAEDRERGRRTGWAFERVGWAEVRCRPGELQERVLRRVAELSRRRDRR